MKKWKNLLLDLNDFLFFKIKKKNWPMKSICENIDYFVIAIQSQTDMSVYIESVKNKLKMQIMKCI